MPLKQRDLYTTEDEHLIKQLRVSKKYSKTVA